MRNIRPALTFILLVFVQSLCVLPGQAPAPVTSTPISPQMAIAATQTAASSIQVTEEIQATAIPQAESAGTINLVLAQVQSGPPDNLQLLEGIKDFYNGEAVRVTGGGKGILNLSDGTKMTLFNGTEASDFTVTTAPRASDLFLQREGFFGEVPEGSDATVRLPNGARLLILGTQFFVLYDEETQVATAGNFDGMVLYTLPNGTEEELSPGRMVNIPAQGAGVLMELPFTPEQFEVAVDNAGTPTVGLAVLIREYQIKPLANVPQVPITSQKVITMDHGASVGYVMFTSDGKYVLSDSFGDIVRVWDPTTGQEVARLGPQGDLGVDDVGGDFSLDGRYMVGGGWEFTAHVWDIFTGQEIASLDHDFYVWDRAFSPNGKYVVSSTDDGFAHVWDLSTGTKVHSVLHDDRQIDFAISSDSQYVVSAGCEEYDTGGYPCIRGGARVWELLTGKEVARMPQVPNISDVIFSPDGNYVATRWEGSIHVWDASTGTEVTQINYDGLVSVFVFSPDSKYLASVPLDSIDASYISVWDISAGREVFRLTHDDIVETMAFSPDGKYLVSGSWDNAVRVWDFFTGTEVARMDHNNSVNSVAFSPDGDYVVSGSSDNTARIWMWQPECQIGC
jgi:WD40 repeat protein